MEFEQYLKERKAAGTVKRYLREIELFSFSIENISTADYTQIMDYIGKLRIKQKNIMPSLCAIKMYYNYLIFIDKRDDNPAKSIRLRDKQRRDVQLQDLFSTEELALLLGRKERYAILKNRNLIIISLLIFQALTSGEIMNLELEDINLSATTIYVKSTQKSNARTLKLQSRQVFWLMNYLQIDRPKLLKTNTQKLLISKSGTEEKGETINYVIECFKPLFPDRILNTKTIRQSVICNLLKAGTDLRIVQAFAGHKYPSSTERYKQTDLEELKNQVLKYHPLNK